MSLWQLPPADPDNWWQTTNAGARALRGNRWLFWTATLLVAWATVWAAYAELHGATKFVVIVVGAIPSPVIIVWGLSWIVAGAIALPRQRAEAVQQRDKARAMADSLQNRFEFIRELDARRCQAREMKDTFDGNMANANEALRNYLNGLSQLLQRFPEFASPSQIAPVRFPVVPCATFDDVRGYYEQWETILEGHLNIRNGPIFQVPEEDE